MKWDVTLLSTSTALLGTSDICLRVAVIHLILFVSLCCLASQYPTWECISFSRMQQTAWLVFARIRGKEFRAVIAVL